MIGLFFDRIRKFIEELIKLFFLEDIARSEAGTFVRAYENIFAFPRIFKLERIEPANERSHIVNRAQTLMKEQAFPFQCLFHAVNVGFKTLNFVCEVIETFARVQSYAVCFRFQKKDHSDFFIGIAAAKRTLVTLKTESFRVLKRQSVIRRSL